MKIVRARHATSALAVIALFLLGTPVAGQEASPRPFSEIFPTQLDNLPWQQTSITSGDELFAGLDPEDPRDSIQILKTRQFLAATGASIEDVTSATGFRVDDDGSLSVVSAYQISGVDPSIMRDVVQAQFVESYASNLIDPKAEVLFESNGREVIQVYDAALTNSDGEKQSLYFFVNGDTSWTVDVDDAELEGVIDELFVEDQ